MLRCTAFSEYFTIGWFAFPLNKDNQEKLHKEFKDNPSAVFDKNIRTGKYQWRMLFDSKEKNPRCEKAINDSIVFLRKAFSYMQ